MSNHVDKELSKSQSEKISNCFAARIEDTYAYTFERKTGRQIAWVLISDIVPIRDNKKIIVSIILRYVSYLQGGCEMEYKASNVIDVAINNGIATLYDKRTGQLIAQLRYNPLVSPMETMAFLSAVMQDYERYMKLLEKTYRG